MPQQAPGEMLAPERDASERPGASRTASFDSLDEFLSEARPWGAACVHQQACLPQERRHRA